MSLLNPFFLHLKLATDSTIIWFSRKTTSIPIQRDLNPLNNSHGVVTQIQVVGSARNDGLACKNKQIKFYEVEKDTQSRWNHLTTVMIP